MKKGLFILLIFCFSLTIISCSDDKEEYSATATTTTDTTAPVIAEVTAVTTPTNDSTPNYTFSSDERQVLSLMEVPVLQVPPLQLVEIIPSL